MSVTIRELATELEVNRSQLRKWIIRQLPNVSIFKMRDPNGRGCEVIAVSPDHAEIIRTERGRWNGSRVRTESGDAETFGVFYAIQLLPDIAPDRVKFGFTTNLESRLQTHRCTCPDAKPLQTWRCNPLWEAAGLAAVGACESVSHVGGEVFDCKEIDATLATVTQLFDLLTRPRRAEGV